jgi:protein-L-isoaspartate O-methyltransferase
MNDSTLVDTLAEERPPATEWLGVNIALGVLMSAFLLFQVQPLISKFILPWFGGSPAVWTTCMLFFQAVLFCGYAYAHFTSQWLSARQQGALHIALLIAACALSPVVPDESWKTGLETDPTLRIFLLLASCIGLPYFVLSSTGPLLQAWYGKTYPGRSPYRLYALSNFGSLVALVSYPFLFEPALDALELAQLWRGGFVAFAASCGLAAWARYRSGELRQSSAKLLAGSETRLPPAHRVLWLALPACASLMLLAGTNHICQDVAVIPFLWVAPLALYLVSFIVAFDHPRWYRRRFFAVATLLLSVAIGCISSVENGLEMVGYSMGFAVQVSIHLALVFCICMLSHGELVRLRPGPAHLTEFYLMISAGGAIGGALVSLAAPRLFDSFVEWPVGLMLSAVFAVVIISRAFFPPFAQARLQYGAAGLGALGAVLLIGREQFQHDPDEVDVARNFYGVVGVYDVDREDPVGRYRALTHGIVVHGRQFMAPDKRSLPLAYYGPTSGVGRVATLLQTRADLRVGVVGLGVGTLAAYLNAGQTIRFYEINPEVERLARQYFTYLDDSAGKVELVMGDARLVLEAEAPQGYHLLVLDAFSGDAVPAHLLTREAFGLYGQHLAPDGVLAVNITNHKLALAPVIETLAEVNGMQTLRIVTPAQGDQLLYRADWMLLSRDRDVLARVPHTPEAEQVTGKRLLWTDRYSNLFSVMK